MPSNTPETQAHPIDALRQMVADDIKRNGDFSSFMIRNRKLADLLDELARHRQSSSNAGGVNVPLLELVAGYADYKAISDDRWEQGKAAGYRELGEMVSAALASLPTPTAEPTSPCPGDGMREALEEIAQGFENWSPEGEYASTALHRMQEIARAALTPSALSGDNSQSSSNAGGVDEVIAAAAEVCGGGQASRHSVNRLRAALASLSTPAEPMAELQRLGQEYDGEAVRKKCRLCNGRGGVTEDQGDGYYVGAECPICGGHGFSEEIEDELWEVIMDAHGPDSNARHYAKAALLWFARRTLTTPPTPDRIGKDAVREADVALLGARMVLEGKATNATGALAKTDWKPSRTHVEGMRNTMREAIEYIDEARTALSATTAQEGEGVRLHRITRAAAERYSLDIPTLEHFGLLADSLSPAQPVDETERLRTKALRAAEQFIVNGIEMGYITMPDASTPDPAHDTLPLIRAALSQDKGEVSRG